MRERGTAVHEVLGGKVTRDPPAGRRAVLPPKGTELTRAQPDERLTLNDNYTFCDGT